eukprot:409731-Prorocentrum_minimum.AAC.1
MCTELDTDIRPLRRRSTTGKFNFSPNYAILPPMMCCHWSPPRQRRRAVHDLTTPNMTKCIRCLRAKSLYGTHCPPPSSVHQWVDSEPIERGEGVYTCTVSQSHEGRGYIPAPRANHTRGG